MHELKLPAEKGRRCQVPFLVSRQVAFQLRAAGSQKFRSVAVQAFLELQVYWLGGVMDPGCREGWMTCEYLSTGLASLVPEYRPCQFHGGDIGIEITGSWGERASI